MVSNASEDLPDPESPVMTVKVFRGISTLMFFRLCCRAPRITSCSGPYEFVVRRDGRQEPSIWSESAPSRRSLPAAGTACLCSQALELSSYTEPTLTLHDNRRETKRSRI